MGRHKKWSLHQENVILELAAKETDEAIAAKLGVTKNAVKRKRQELGIAKQRGRGVCKLVAPKGLTDEDTNSPNVL